MSASLCCWRAFSTRASAARSAKPIATEAAPKMMNPPTAITSKHRMPTRMNSGRSRSLSSLTFSMFAHLCAPQCGHHTFLEKRRYLGSSTRTAPRRLVLVTLRDFEKKVRASSAASTSNRAPHVPHVACATRPERDAELRKRRTAMTPQKTTHASSATPITMSTIMRGSTVTTPFTGTAKRGRGLPPAP